MSQPVEVYPNPVMTRQPDSSHSNGSFGPVFAVLAVIVVISAVACVLGRLFSKRHHRAKEAAHHPPRLWESRQKPSFNMRDGDIEFGFDKRIPSGKGPKNGGGKAKPPHHNGAHKPEVRFADNV
ncbi:hypothetical protein Pfo_024197 [Paulownia fortunei]|nr:hypothetical protein Pfo_024197 [Paulownia fortunei]